MCCTENLITEFLWVSRVTGISFTLFCQPIDDSVCVVSVCLSIIRYLEVLLMTCFSTSSIVCFSPLDLKHLKLMQHVLSIHESDRCFQFGSSLTSPPKHSFIHSASDVRREKHATLIPFYKSLHVLNFTSRLNKEPWMEIWFKNSLSKEQQAFSVSWIWFKSQSPDSICMKSSPGSLFHSPDFIPVSGLVLSLSLSLLFESQESGDNTKGRNSLPFGEFCLPVNQQGFVYNSQKKFWFKWEPGRDSWKERWNQKESYRQFYLLRAIFVVHPASSCASCHYRDYSKRQPFSVVVVRGFSFFFLSVDVCLIFPSLSFFSAQESSSFFSPLSSLSLCRFCQFWSLEPLHNETSSLSRENFVFWEGNYFPLWLTWERQWRLKRKNLKSKKSQEIPKTMFQKKRDTTEVFRRLHVAWMTHLVNQTQIQTSVLPVFL